MRLRPLYLSLCLIVATGGLCRGAWQERYRVEVPHGNLSFTSRWHKNQGLHLRFQQPGKKGWLEVTITRDEAVVELSGRKLDAVRPNLAALPGKNLERAEVLVKIRPETWSVYVEKQRVLSFPGLLAAPLTFHQAADEVPPKPRQRLQKTAPFTLTESFTTAKADFWELGAWQVVSGKWRLHTALSDAIEQRSSSRLSARPLQPERSPNFFSLKGHGKEALIISGYPFQDNYELRSSLLVAAGELGVVFYYRGPGDYYAFTMTVPEAAGQDTTLRLWRRDSKKVPHLKQLGAAVTRLTKKQWVQARVRVRGNRIQCYLGETQVLDATDELPPGGRRGLYVNSESEQRFDDVVTSSDRQLDLDDTEKIRFHTVAREGQFEAAAKKKSFWSFGHQAAPTTKLFLDPPASRSARWLAVGSTQHEPHVFAARFAPATKSYTVGLVLGRRDASAPHYRFLASRKEGRESFALVEVRAGRENRLRQISLPAGEFAPLTLMSDAAMPGELRLYRDNEMVLIHHWPQLPKLADNDQPGDQPARYDYQGGASGVYLGAGTRARISRLDYRFTRGDLYRNHYEKNQIYATDPFMRHWSSPEGQWYHDAETDLVWYKSDFFGRFALHLPLVAKSQAHLAIREGSIDGGYVVAVDEKDLVLYAGPEPAADGAADALAPNRHGKELARAALPTEAFAIRDRAAYSIQYEDRWLWATSAGEPLFAHQLEEPLQGSRVRVAGFTMGDLMQSHAERYNVKDHLFSTAPYDWTLNGGRWQIINRFQCDPRWSHMNGESRDNLAALWAKYEFSGDFCMELYAGIRHGWYNRCGDLNLTIMNQQTTPGQGYTVTTTGWDQDHSQMWTKLYRNGEVVAKSDKYLVPRYRAGNKRLRFEEVITGGQRDVHGAWYYMKLRRIGKKIEYWFDNELVLETEDDKPIDVGSAGIWTYMNSMMVARVKVAAEGIRPQPLEFAPLAHPDQARPPPPPVSDLQLAMRLNGQPLEPMQPANWTVADETGQSALTWRETPGKAPYMVLRSALGGGRMTAACQQAPVPYANLAGWRFLVKRTDQARFNFHYSVGRLSGEKFVPAKSFYYQLSGPHFPRGTFVRSGLTEVDGVGSTDEDWHERGGWTEVAVWLASDSFDLNAVDPNLLVQADGFGLVQPSFAMQGLEGNGPGAAYAVKDFTPIYFHAPKLSTTATKTGRLSYMLLDAAGEVVRSQSPSLVGLGRWLEGREEEGYRQHVLRVLSGGSQATDFRLDWIRRPKTPSFEVAWASNVSDSLVLRSAADYPDRRVARASVRVGDTATAHSPLAPGQRLLRLAPTGLAGKAPESLAVAVTYSGESRPLALAWDERPPTTLPVLIKLDGASGLFENFEHGSLGATVTPVAQRTILRYDDPEQGSFLETRNTQYGQRLATVFNWSSSLARFPFLQFRYRATPMSNVTLAMQSHHVKISEEFAGATEVRFASDFERDGQWHTWTGLISDAVRGHTYSPRLYHPNNLRLASMHKYDQTGRYSHLDLDDIVLGPAVASGEGLAFTATYADNDGVDQVLTAVRAGPEPFAQLDSQQAAKLRWAKAANGSRCVPDLAGLSQGPCHLFIKAIDSRGTESAVTDIPFLHDRQPVSVTHSLAPSSDVLSNGQVLQLLFDVGPGAPLDLESLTVKHKGKALPLNSTSCQYLHEREKEQLRLNWPLLLSSAIQGAKSGDTIAMSVGGIRDGAGNAAPELNVPIKLDYARDRQGPALLSSRTPGAIVWRMSWEGRSDRPLYFTGDKTNTVRVVHRMNQEPYLEWLGKIDSGSIKMSLSAWKVRTYPYISLRLRQPRIPPKKSYKLYLQLTTNHSQTFVVPLNYEVEGAKVLPLAQPLKWKAGEWQQVTVNVLAALAEKNLNRMITETLRFTTVSLVRAGGGAKFPVHLQSWTVHADYRAADEVKLNAYDASGLGGIVWKYSDAAGKVLQTGSSAELAFKPTALGVKTVPGGWLAVSAKDRAGNLSRPIRLPYSKPR